jgi:hypothetical protein
MAYAANAGSTALPGRKATSLFDLFVDYERRIKAAGKRDARQQARQTGRRVNL